MATASDVTKEPHEEHVARKLDKAAPTRGKGKRDKLAIPDSMTALESRLVRGELTVTDHHDRWDELDQCKEQLDGEGMPGVLNEAIDQLVRGNDTIWDLVEFLHEKIVRLKGELESYKTQLA